MGLDVRLKTARLYLVTDLRGGAKEFGAFAVNLLAADQAGLAARMAGRGVDRFAGVDWSPSPVTGSPLLAGTVGYVDCRLEAVHDAGDHHVVLGHVLDLGRPHEDDPGAGLTFYRGRYGSTG